MAQLTRRNFVQVAAAAAGTAALAACANEAAPEPEAEPEPEVEPEPEAEAEPEPAGEASYPIEPEEFGSGDVKYTIEEVDGRPSWFRVVNDGGAVLGVSDKAKLIQVDGYCFKDLSGNGKLDLWEDWRKSPEERAADLVSQMPEEDILAQCVVPMAVYTSGNIGSTLDDIAKGLIDECKRQIFGGHFFLGQPVNGFTWANWSNDLQSYAEQSHMGIPVTIYADPFGSEEVSWPGQVGLAATFDPEVARTQGLRRSEMWRALGVHTILGPQMDTATEPRWSRAEGTYGEDPALSRDMAQAEVNAMQSSYDEAGNDLGWGATSVSAMPKHWPGDGAGMFGWESHNRAGRFSQFDGGNFETQLIPFVDGAFQLPGKTERAACIMPSYSVAFSEDGEWGENVGSAFSEYKMQLLRKDLGFDGLVVSDWQIVDDNREGDREFHTWGVEDLTPGERAKKAWLAGTDVFGGQDDFTPVTDGYELLKEELGDADALAFISGVAERAFRTSFRVGIFDNAYVDADASSALVDGDEQKAAAYEATLKSIVMLKNDGVIGKDTGEKLTVYVPRVFVASRIEGAAPGHGELFYPSSAELPLDQALLEEYFNLVTDTIAETLTDLDQDGNPMIAEADVIRATSEQLAACDFALVVVQQPQNASNANGIDSEGNYIPVSMQYRPYTATAESGCPEVSFAGSFEGNAADPVHGPLTADGKENLSPIGNTSLVTNESDLDLILSTAKTMGDGKVVVCVNSNKAGMIPAEFEPEVDAILFGWKVSDRAFMDIVSGKFEPSALLPIQLPKDMYTVETQLTDTPRDMDCYVDAAGNAYDFGFGLNWSGVIDDERVAKYCVAPIMRPENL